jgi:hypothetical protein
MTDLSQDTQPTPGEDANSLLVASNKVDDLKVEGRDGEHLGYVHSLMLNKGTGAATYAIVALGGFLGVGRSYYPLPFQLLRYDRPTDRYVVTIDKRLLEGGPSWAANAPSFTQAYADRVASYYGVPSIDIS